SGDPSCGQFAVAGGAVAATCSVPFSWITDGFPLLSEMIGRSFPVAVSVSDPWERSGSIAAAITPATPPPPGPVAAQLTRQATCSCQCTTIDCHAQAPCETVEYVPTMSYGPPLRVTVERPDGRSTTM